MGLIADENVHLAVASGTPSQLDSLFLFELEGFLRPHGNEVPFYLGNESECEDQHFGVDAVVECESVLDAVQAHLLLQQFAYDCHYVHERAAESGDFGHYESVSLLELFDERSELAVPSFRASADHLGYPSVYLDAVPAAVVLNLVLLVVKHLVPCANP